MDQASLNHISSKQDALHNVLNMVEKSFLFLSLEVLAFVYLKDTFLMAQCIGKGSGLFSCKGNMPSNHRMHKQHENPPSLLNTWFPWLSTNMDFESGRNAET